MMLKYNEKDAPFENFFRIVNMHFLRTVRSFYKVRSKTQWCF